MFKKLMFFATCAGFAHALYAGGDPFDELQKMATAAGKPDLKFTRGMPRDEFEHACTQLRAQCHPDKHYGEEKKYNDLSATISSLCEKVIKTPKALVDTPVPPPAPKKELSPEQKRLQEMFNRLRKDAFAAYNAGSDAAKRNDFASAKTEFLKSAQIFQKIIVDLGLPEGTPGNLIGKNGKTFMEQLVTATDKLSAIQKDFQTIAASIENGTIEPSRNYLTISKQLTGQSGHVGVLKTDLNAKIPKKEVPLERISICDKLLQDIETLLSAARNESDGFRIHASETAESKFKMAKSGYETLNLTKAAQRMSEKVAYTQALIAERVAIDARSNPKILELEPLWKDAKQKWLDAASIATDSALKAGYEKRARDIDDHEQREKIIYGTYKKA